MKKLSRTLLCLTCTLAIGVAALSGCANNNGTTLSQYEGDVVHYSSSDAGLANFLNDFTRRNLRFDEESIAAPESTLGNGTGFAKNWETMGLVWHNSAGKVLGENKLEKLETFLRTITQDGQGMIYNTHNNLMAGRSQAGDGISQGWPFPTHNNSGGRSTAFEFNYATEQASWSVSQGGTLSVGTDGYARFTYSAPSAGSAFRMTNSSFRTVNAGGIDTKHAPIVEIELAYVDANHAIGSGTDVAEVSLIFQTESGGDTWYRAPQSLYATTPVTLGYALNERMYFSMYLHENWDGEIVTALGIEISAKDGKTLKLTDGKINYIRPGYDTRQSNATYQFILALGNYVAYTNNNAFLEEMLPKARRAVLFLTHALEGEDGLLDISYLYGHNGIGSSTEDGKLVRNIGDGIGNGYWDILTAPEKNLEANTYFYQALGVMAARLPPSRTAFPVRRQSSMTIRRTVWRPCRERSRGTWSRRSIPCSARTAPGKTRAASGASRQDALSAASARITAQSLITALCIGMRRPLRPASAPRPREIPSCPGSTARARLPGIRARVRISTSMNLRPGSPPRRIPWTTAFITPRPVTASRCRTAAQ